MPKERTLIEVRLSGLSQGIHEFGFDCSVSDFDDPALKEAGFSDGISVRAVLERNEDEITVTIETTALADRSCDLCLAPVKLDLHGAYRITYVYDQRQDDGPEQDEEFRVIDRNTVSIDLTEDVRETLLLSVPMKVTCADYPDCRRYGQEPPPGNDMTPDSTWQESLEKLKNKYR
jgi:uncharacterized protein